MAKWIVTLLQQKGGAGKSTTAVHLACMFKHLYPELTVVVADADTQGSAYMWLSKGADTGVGVVRVALDGNGDNIKQELLDINADIVVLDLPPHIKLLPHKAAFHSSIILIPIGPSELETDSAKDPIRLVKDVIEFRPTLEYILVPNKVRMNTAAGKELRSALEMWGRVSKATLNLRSAFSDAVSLGVGVDQFAPNSPAYEEMKELALEVLESIGAIEGRA
jgi:chromosome partitioning protein